MILNKIRNVISMKGIALLCGIATMLVWLYIGLHICITAPSSTPTNLDNLNVAQYYDTKVSDLLLQIRATMNADSILFFGYIKENDPLIQTPYLEKKLLGVSSEKHEDMILSYFNELKNSTEIDMEQYKYHKAKQCLFRKVDTNNPNYSVLVSFNVKEYLTCPLFMNNNLVGYLGISWHSNSDYKFRKGNLITLRPHLVEFEKLIRDYNRL